MTCSGAMHYKKTSVRSQQCM